MTDEQQKRNEEEEDSEPYKSIQDWLDDNSHFKWPMIIMGILILILIILIDLNII